MQKRLTVGLTGGIGSGKTTIANLFGELGAAIVDTDLIAHQLTQPDGLAIPAIRDQFGETYITADGALNRARMRELVFTDTHKKLLLESILHPMIRQATELASQTSEGSYLILVIPLLVESGNWRQKLDRIVVVDCYEQTQVQRVMERNQLSEEQVRAIMRAQASRQQRLDAADDVIENNGDLNLAKHQVAILHQQFLALSGK